MNVNSAFKSYIGMYLLSASAMLIASWFGGGAKGLVTAFLLFLFSSKVAGPLLFHRLLNRETVHVPFVGELGPKSEHWEWRLYAWVYGLLPTFLFSSLAIGYAVRFFSSSP